MITLCGSTYAKFVCSIILKQPSITTCCSSSIELNLQAHSILESNSLLILFFFFTILIISHQPFLFNKKRQKKSTFYSRLNFSSGATILPFGAITEQVCEKIYLQIVMRFFYIIRFIIFILI